MSFSRAEIKQLLVPALACTLLFAAGAAIVWSARSVERSAQQQLAAVRAEHKQSASRLARIAEEEREVKEKLAVYRQLQSLNILGEERRLEWADTVGRIRKEREFLDLRYRVEPQKLVLSIAGKPANVDFFASTMKVNFALLHEEDLLRLIADLRAAGNAYYSVRRCALVRTEHPAGAPTLAPRLRAECDIDLITIMDRAAKR